MIVTMHICITPMVDVLLLRGFVRCKQLVVIDVFIDVYVTCSCMLYSNQTCMQERMWVTCALGAVIGK
jgi:hypothetical protein